MRDIFSFFEKPKDPLSFSPWRRSICVCVKWDSELRMGSP